MEKIKDLIAHLFIKGRLHGAISPFIGSRGNCAVLMYHRILPESDLFQPSVSYDDFSSDMDFFAGNFKPVPLSALAAGSPGGSVAVTIDDGYREIYDFVYPLARERGVPVTAFIVTDFVGTERMLWTTELSEIVRKAGIDSIELGTMGGKRYSLGSVEEKLAFIGFIKRFGKSAPSRRRDPVLDEIREKLGGLSGMGRIMLSWDELAEMGDSCMEFGSHTRSHAILSGLDREEAWSEISGSKAELESRLGREVVSFCYPNGQEGDFTGETIAMVREAGYSLAVTSISGANYPSIDRYALRRLWTEGCTRENLYARLYRAFLFP